MQPRTAVVTGATGGIGVETARGLSKAGFGVVMACRDPQRGQAVRQTLLAEDAGADLVVCELDLADPASIDAFAAHLPTVAPHVAVLVNNAGVWDQRRRETAEGLERTFAVNHLGTFRLTQALLPQLRAAAASQKSARVVTVASMAHWSARPDWDDLQMAHHYNGNRQYGNTKLYNIWFASELARRLEGTGITSNSLHPGTGKTGLTRDFPAWIDPLWQWMGKRPSTLAETSIRLATDPSMDRVTGGYFHRKRRGRMSRLAQDGQAARRLWQLTQDLA